MTSAPPDAEARRDWLAVLAQAPRDALARCAGPALAGQHFETLRPAEVGLVMLRGRADGSGARFNLGEATITRCVLRHRGADAHAAIGVGYRLGRDTERAHWMAALDALLQQPALHAPLMRGVVQPLREAVAQQQAEDQRRAAASQVRFYTLQPETPR